MTKKALITGIEGQDGYYLANLLIDRGYEVYGAALAATQVPEELKAKLSGLSEVNLSVEPLVKIMRASDPDEVYFLAAHHFSSQEDQNRTGDLKDFILVNLLAPNSVLEEIKYRLPRTRFFYPASSHIFGVPDRSPQDETTPHRPDTPYAISKSWGLHLCRFYREKYGIHASVGIMYNHESPRRGPTFVTAMIARAAALAYMGKPETLKLHNLDAVVDWGAAEDYVRAMWLMLQQPKGDEYIVSSGAGHTVRDFARQAFCCLGLDYETYIHCESKPKNRDEFPLIGNHAKISRACGWQPALPFEQIVRGMVERQIADLKAS